MFVIAQQGGMPPAPIPEIMGLMGLLPCCFATLILGQFVLFIVALVQILSRNMPTDAKLLWGAVAWLVPVVGPILWWTIGTKQNPERPPGPPPLA